MNHPTNAFTQTNGLPFEAKLIALLFALVVAATAFTVFSGALGR